MEFDKSKVYTALNADELKIGSMVIAADTLKNLKDKVEAGGYETELYDIKDDCNIYRFNVGKGITSQLFALAYLVEEPAKLKWTDLKVGDVIRKDTQESMVLAIDRSKNTHAHILTCGYKDYSTDLFWIGNEELGEWEKIENDND